MHSANLLHRWRWLPLAFGGALLMAALTFEVFRQRGMTQETESAHGELQIRAALITSEIARLRLLPIALEDDLDVVAAVDGDKRARSALNRKLETLVRLTASEAIYIVGKDGRAIAASNWRSAQSFVGSDYSSRRYVRDALANGLASHFAMGTVSNRPGLYIAQRTTAGGVVVIKLDFDAVEKEWAKGDGATFVTDPRGIVLVSSRPEWRFMLTRPLPPRVLDAFRRDAMLPALVAQRAPIRFLGNKAVLDGRQMIAVSAPLAQPGWSITRLQPVEVVTKFAQIAAALVGILVLGSALLGGMLRERARERRQRTVELERAVAERTSDLRREMEERAASEAQAADLREGLRQANRLASLGQITASVAHETAQPVAAIRTYADTTRVLLQNGNQQAVLENLSAIARLADRIGSITSELRGFSRRGSRDVGPVAVGAVIEGALLILREQLRPISVALPKGETDILVSGGKVRLEQVLVNLLHNAAEALHGTRDPQINLELHFAAESIVLSIADNGPGVPADLAAKLFTPFVTSRPDGLGLGLVIAQDIMVDIGGSLRLVPSAVGARFDMTMRRA